MELATPGIGLIFWQTLTFLFIMPLAAIAWIMILVTNKLDGTNKLVWLLGTLVLPILGPLIFFVKYRSFKRISAEV